MPPRRGRSGRRRYTPQQGYGGSVILVSPLGETRIVYLPPRYRFGGVLQSYESHRPEDTKRFYRLLSAGWQVIAHGGRQPSGQHNPAKQKAPEQVAVVAPATSMVSEDIHGGDEATQDISDSPKAADDGQNPNNQGAEAGDGKDSKTTRPRGQRGGRGRQKSQHEPKKQASHPKVVKEARQSGGQGVFCLQPFTVKSSTRHDAAKSAALLAELVGQSSLKTIQGTDIDIFDLLIALEIGDNPLPALECPRLRPRMRVLITPDSSGSTQNWSGLARAWSIELSKVPEVDVLYVDNMNGQFVGPAQDFLPDSAVDELLRKIDLVVYLGDEDGKNFCCDCASQGTMVVALDSYCAYRASPRLSITQVGGGFVYWVDQVSVHNTDSWSEALQLVICQLSH